ncbi:GNAT family N-acetyltransferase [Streptacidiphilus rugosus]|uniref:GNAT family N-acetyltransferase n=1 Tax=Streptacidiphilus rugosus TaxID=405783 RepID=UPI0005613E41|nr:GNAT family N-acetyltransferase [Streptacidiphilus rugosus]
MSTRETEAEVMVADAPEAQRFEARIEGDLVGFASYLRDDVRVVYQHTVVGPAYEGMGIGGLLARAAVEDGISRGIEVRVTCPFIKAWLTRHPEYQDKLSGTPGA